MVRFTTPTEEITYGGIDYHKKASVIALGDSQGRLVLRERLINDERIIREFFGRYPGIHCAVESCRGYEWFVDLLKEMGLEVTVCDPRRVRLIAESMNKTDKRDSQILMELLAKGYLPACYQPSMEERALREQLRWRVHLMKTSTRIKLRIHALLDKENKGLNCPDPFTVKGRQYLKDVHMAPFRRALLDKHLSVLEFIEQQLNVEHRWIAQEVKKRPLAQLVKTIPGIGDISAMMLIAELGDVTRFKRSEQVSAYLGLVPSENSSGDRRRLGRITKQGSKLLRWLLIQDAWIAVRNDFDLRRRFLQVSASRGNNVAIVGIARKLGEIAYCVMRDEKPYDPQRLTTGTAAQAAGR